MRSKWCCCCRQTRHKQAVRRSVSWMRHWWGVTPLLLIQRQAELLKEMSWFASSLHSTFTQAQGGDIISSYLSKSQRGFEVFRLVSNGNWMIQLKRSTGSVIEEWRCFNLWNPQTVSSEMLYESQLQGSRWTQFMPKLEMQLQHDDVVFEVRREAQNFECITLLSWWVVIMGPTIDSRVKAHDAKLSLLFILTLKLEQLNTTHLMNSSAFTVE